jgi:DNA topoisomerase-6 subunit B
MSNKRAAQATAIEMAKRQREISVSEYFLKNRHLLGFDTPSKAVVTAVKEAVDNALDACEEAGILPDITVELADGHGRSRIVVEDNGPGIIEGQIARIFGKLLYGSKFHKLSQSRGQQGMGISAAGMYAQLTAAKPLHIISRIAGDELASELYVSIDIARNQPDIHKKRRLPWDRSQGTRVEMEMEGQYQRGAHSVDAYLKQVAIANPHVAIIYRSPRGDEIRFPRSTKELPPLAKEVKPHPHGIELGRLIQLLTDTRSRTLLRFLMDEFSRVGRKKALKIIENAGKPLSDRSYPRHIARAQAMALHKALQDTRVLAPKADCIVPIGEKQLLAGLHKELKADFCTVVTRPAASYRGNPFQVEVGLAFGHSGAGIAEDSTQQRSDGMPAADHPPARNEESVHLLRFANRVPLLYQQSSCAITKAVLQTNWRPYGLHQSKGALPIAPMAILVHVASVWVPYTSESKEAVEPYPEILQEIKLGLQQCGRRLALHLHHKSLLQQEQERRNYIERYLPHIGAALQEILGFGNEDRDAIVTKLDKVLLESRAATGGNHD